VGRVSSGKSGTNPRAERTIYAREGNLNSFPKKGIGKRSILLKGEKQKIFTHDRRTQEKGNQGRGKEFLLPVERRTMAPKGMVKKWSREKLKTGDGGKKG